MKNYLNIEELAEYIHMSKSTIYKGTMSNRIPHIKAGKKLLFSQDAIDQWLQKFNQPTIEEVEADINSILKFKQNGR
jgi:excisionase family DNA binding protein